uniref:Uncharacterized protein n=1 Tax=Solanum lycopersicum TaxID=4081 RepID=A0A3Q7GCL7_SOLLC
MDFGHDPKLPLLIRAMVRSWCENSAAISVSVMAFAVVDGPFSRRKSPEDMVRILLEFN